ncbi:MAG: MATE family efflux transporter [Gammaproteobacteria bacterium]|nr:MATE family efflux transporter [Gammaproteobacteria bacterium]
MNIPANQSLRERFGEEAARVLRLAGPLVVGQFAIMGMGVTDVVVSGRAGTDDLAAVTIGFYLWDLSMLFVFGVVLANSALVGHHYGGGKGECIRRQFQQCLWLSLPLALASGLMLHAAMRGVTRLDITPEVARIAAGYLLPTILTSMLMPFMVTLRTTCEGVGLTRPVMWLTMAAFLINIPLDFGLVSGAFGLPRLGGAGCGWATLVSFLLMMLCWVIYFSLSPTLRIYRLWSEFGPPVWRDIRAILSLGLPIGLSLFAVGGFFAIVPLLMAGLGAVAVAGHAVAITVDTLMLTVPLGVGQAMSVRVAHQLGGGDPRRAREVCIIGMSLLMAIAVLQAAVMVACREPITLLFSDDPAVRELGAGLLLFAATYRLFDSVQVGAGMALRGYQDTRVSSAIDISAYWLFGLPLCYGLGLGTLWGEPLGVRGFWIGMVVAIALAAMLIAWRLVRISARLIRQPGLGTPPPGDMEIHQK